MSAVRVLAPTWRPMTSKEAVHRARGHGRFGSVLDKEWEVTGK